MQQLSDFVTTVETDLGQAVLHFLRQAVAIATTPVTQLGGIPLIFPALAMLAFGLAFVTLVQYALALPKERPADTETAQTADE